jgi:hypothetical protein
MSRDILNADVVFVLFALAGCGGKGEEFRTDDAASSADVPGAPPFPRVDGVCQFGPAKVTLTPHPHNEPQCQASVECRSRMGHGAMFLDCPSGIGSDAPIYTGECDRVSCSCINPEARVGVFFDASPSARGLIGLSSFCRYSVEVVHTLSVP